MQSYRIYNSLIFKKSEFNSVFNRLAELTNSKLSSMQVHQDTWAGQIKNAMNVNGGDIENASTTDYVMHFLTFGWKVAFSKL